MVALIAANEAVKLSVGYQFFLSGYTLPIIIFNSISTAICLGCLLAYALDREKSFRVAWNILGQRWSAPVFAIIMLIVSIVPNSNSLEVGRMFLICVAMTLAVGVCSIRNDTLLVPILTNRVVRYIGTISYGMYLYHAFGINVTDRFFMPLLVRVGVGGGFLRGLQFLIVASCTAAFASLSYWGYERYFLRLKERFTLHRPTSPVVTEVVLSTD